MSSYGLPYRLAMCDLKIYTLKYIYIFIQCMLIYVDVKK